MLLALPQRLVGGSPMRSPVVAFVTIELRLTDVAARGDRCCQVAIIRHLEFPLLAIPL